ncbi:MAG: hypothetical protein GY739_11285 [Mesoflavibacter sp.]|nr:hypothetical protein [Mesoflavibacter sp.]
MTVKVLIHIGPPKSGTSAIQYSLQKNKQKLAANGIYYPKHLIDVNGISSGNLSSIYDVANKDRTINATKVFSLLAKCAELNMHTLLLSSEFFFERINEIVTVLPQAKFITYVRNPLDSFESLYNQSVKRHHKVQPIKMSTKLPMLYLTKLYRLIDELGADKFILRSYSKSAFFKGSIINDFYSILGVETPSDVNKNINSSYSFEALEFKRWLNRFCSPSLALKADKILQTYKSPTGKFSLITPQKFNLYKAQAIDYLNKVSDRCEIFNFEKLREDITNAQQYEFKAQNLALADFIKVADYLHQQDSKLYKSICYTLYLSCYRTCFTGHYGQAFIKRYKLSDISDKNMFKTRVLNFIKCLLGKAIDEEEQPAVLSKFDDINRFRVSLRLGSDVSDVEILRELALVAEKNHDIGLAYTFMKRAQKLRPNGPLINSKIKFYEREIDSSTAKRDDF